MKPNGKNVLSRRDALARIGLFAAAAYAVPAFTTLTVARASESSAPSEPSEPSEPSVPSTPSSAEACGAGETQDPVTGTCVPA
jgi:hypothetical protein